MSLISRRYRWILLLSLALNLALLAFVLLRPAIHDGRGRGLSMVLPPPHVIARILSPEGRQVLERVVDSHRDRIRPTLQAFADARRDIQQQLRSPVVDRDALGAAFSELRQREQRTAVAVQQMLIELSLQLPLADRQKLADVIDRGRGGDHRRRQRKQQSDPVEPQAANPASDSAPTP